MKNVFTISLIVAAALAAGCQKNQGTANIKLGPVDPPEDVLAAYGTPASSAPLMPSLGPATLPPPPKPAVSTTAALPAPPAAVEPAVLAAPTPIVKPAYTPAAPVKPAAPAPTAGRTHVVQAGETLWRISGMYYGKASRANVTKIVQANPTLTDPNKIAVGQKLVIPD